MPLQLLAVALLGGAVVLGARFYLHREYSRDGCRPCGDLESCQPLSLSLETKQPWPRAGRAYTV